MTEAKIAVLMACHNRRDTTIACLSSLRKSLAAAGDAVSANLVVVDDGSTDGTAEAVAKQWPGARAIAANGSLYWAASMALAERTAIRELQDATHLLWLNDDVALDQGAITALLDASRSLAGTDAIAVGALLGPDAEISYSGIRLLGGFDPLKFERIVPSGTPQSCDTLNGNVVLVPASAARLLGGVDGDFAHSLADFDYGVRARKAGVEILLTPSTLGSCPRNSLSRPNNIRSRWQFVFDRKGDALADRARYLRRHGSPASLVLLAVPLLRFVAGELSRLPFIGRLVPPRALPIHQR